MSATESLIAPMDQTKSIADTKGVHHNSLLEHRQLSGLSLITGFPLLSFCSTFYQSLSNFLDYITESNLPQCADSPKHNDMIL